MSQRRVAHGPPHLRPAREVLRVAGWTILLAAGGMVTMSCASYQLYSDCLIPSSQCPDQGSDDQEAVLFLVGDAGSKDFDSNPVMQSMKTAVGALDDRGIPTTVLFLGDNIYEEGGPGGLPGDLLLLGAQVEVVAGTSAKGIFVLGNHDWGSNQENGGLERILNQEEVLRAFKRDGADVGLFPQAGCPGPERRNLEDSRGDALATLVLLDSSWWLLEPGTAPRCSPSTKEGMIREVERILSEPSDLPVIVAAHHPLRTGGPHGGNSSSLMWLANRAGLLRNDLNATRYRAFIESMFGVLGGASRPIFFAAGHEHSLQVIEELVEGSSILHLVSGSGSKVTGAGPIDGSRFAAGLPGYMRLDFRSGGRIQLSVIAECSVEAVDVSLCRQEEVGRFQSVYRANVR